MKTQALRLTRIPRVWYRIKDFQDSRVLVCTPNKVISQRWYLDTCCCTTNIVVHSSLVYTLACAQDKILPTFICCTSTSIRFSYFPPSQGKFSSFTLIMEVIKNLSYSTIHGILLQSVCLVLSCVTCCMKRLTHCWWILFQSYKVIN